MIGILVFDKEIEIPGEYNLVMGQEIVLNSGDIYVVEHTGRYLIAEGVITRIEDKEPGKEEATLYGLLNHAWFIWIEGRAIVDKKKGDTLSEHVWIILNVTPLLKWMTVAGLIWLTGHFVTAGKGRWRKIFR